MNIYIAIRGLRNGQAIRPTTWRGYIERIDKNTTDPVYSADSSYSVGDKVKYNGSRYICKIAASSESFDSTKWGRIDNDRYIVFIDREDGTPTDNPSAIYLLTASGEDGAFTCERLGSASDIPAEVKSVHTAWASKTKCPNPVDMPDEELFSVLVSDSWESGNASDYEAQRVGGSGRW